MEWLSILMLSVATRDEASSWTMFYGALSLTGVASERLPDPLWLLWTAKTGGAIQFYAAIDGNHVFVGSHDHHLYALDFGGQLRWKYSTDGKISGNANGFGDKIIVGSYDHRIHYFESVTGKAVWTYKTSNHVSSAPSVAEKKLVFGGCDGQLHVLDATTGREGGHIEAGACIPGSPAVVGGRIFVGHFGNEVLAADPPQRQRPLANKRKRIRVLLHACGHRPMDAHWWTRQASALSAEGNRGFRLGFSHAGRSGQIPGHLW